MVCSVQPAKDNLDDIPFLPKLPRTAIHGKHSYYLQQLLTIDSIYFQAYLPDVTKNERGLTADRYDYCIENNMVGVSVYWSKIDWTTNEASHKRIPLWIEIRYSNRTEEHKTVNVFYFKANEISKSSLMTPSGVYCPGRKSISDKPFPLNAVRLSSFRFQSEFIMSLAKQVLWSNHWYDFDRNLRRIDYPNIHSKPPAKMTDILWYGMGYGFNLNQNTGECKVENISTIVDNGAIFEDLKRSDFSDPNYLFGSKNQKYIYIGNRSIRGIQCEVYQTLRKGMPIGSKNSVSVSEIYIWTQGKRGYPIPIAMQLTPYNHTTSKNFASGDSYVFYFYEWHYYGITDSDLNAYDLSTCYPDKYKESLMMRLDLRVDVNNLTQVVDLINTPNFLYKLRTKIANVASELDLLRITNIRCYVDTDDYTVYALFTLLGRHPDMKIGKSNVIDLKSALFRLETNIYRNLLSVQTKFQGNTITVSAVPLSLKSVVGHYLPSIVTTTKKPTTPSTSKKPTNKAQNTSPSKKMSSKMTSASTPGSVHSHTKHATTPATTTVETKTKPGLESSSKDTQDEKLFTPGVLGGAAVGSLLGGLTLGVIITFVQIKFTNGKFLGIQVI